MIARLRFILGYRRARQLRRTLALDAKRAAYAATVELNLATAGYSRDAGTTSQAAEVLRGALVRAYRSQDLTTTPELEEAIAHAEAVWFELLNPPAD